MLNMERTISDIGELVDARERTKILGRLRANWPVKNGTRWYPIDACQSTDSVHVETAWFAIQVSLELLQQRLIEAGYTEVIQLHEGTPYWDDVPAPDAADRRTPTLLARLAVGSSEAIWVPPQLDWLIYTDHDDGTYFVGKWLVALLQELWRDWDVHQWTTPFYTRPAHRCSSETS